MSYAKYAVAPDDDSLVKLTKLVSILKEAEEEKASLKAQMKEIDELIKELAEQHIPELMDEVGMVQFRTTDGSMVAVKHIVRASIGKAAGARAHDAYRWLDENGHGGVIKRTIVVPFNREDYEAAQALATELKQKYAQASIANKVEPATLTALVRKLLEEGEAVPQDTFGIFDQRVASIK